ncbi:MAG: hypothetical protein COB04_03680 [Gammaproteobacteria bacterium]|nr:MAG: hypothetical protein COB04_03680 [Gammaproteobacteria bacterium]
MRKNRIVTLLSFAALTFGVAGIVFLDSESAVRDFSVKAIEKEVPHTMTRIAKPGAPIRFASNYDGIMALDVVESVDLRLTAQADGELRVVVSARDDILVGDNALERVEQVVAGQTIIVPVSMQASTAGKYYLNIHTSITLDNRTQHRAFALAVHAGAWKKAMNERAIEQGRQSKTSHDGREIMVMQAAETVTWK